MSRILFDAFDSQAITGAAAIDITADFIVQGVNPGDAGSAAINIEADFVVAAAGAATLLGTAAIDITGDFSALGAGDMIGRFGTVAIDITADFVVHGLSVPAVVLQFVPPEPGDPHVAIITHRNN